MPVIILEYDDTTSCFGTLVIRDESFSHEFGREKIVIDDIESFGVMATVGGFEEDVTKALSEKRLAYFKEWFLEKLVER